MPVPVLCFLFLFIKPKYEHTWNKEKDQPIFHCTDWYGWQQLVCTVWTLHNLSLPILSQLIYSSTGRKDTRYSNTTICIGLKYPPTSIIRYQTTNCYWRLFCLCHTNPLHHWWFIPSKDCQPTWCKFSSVLLCIIANPESSQLSTLN